jgi:hypothetical protein
MGVSKFLLEHPDMTNTSMIVGASGAASSGSASWMSAAPLQGHVVVYRDPESTRAAHDHATCGELARRLARLKGYRFAGNYDDGQASGENRYFVPTDTLIGVEYARRLGISTEQDLFGGVAPHPFVATKSISHPLVDENAHAPEGWSEEFGRRIDVAVLRGYTAFNADDALRAALELLRDGAVRVKRALGIGGSGQTVISNRQELERVLADADAVEMLRYGIALEQDLAQVTTYSVGQVRVDDLLATYCGTQRLTNNNHGQTAYGGSDLFVVRGDFDALLARVHDAAARCAIERATRYDAAAFECFPGLLASRRNYDVAVGIDASGGRRFGVLEQSWRLGGASGAEVESLAAFRADAALTSVRASSTERYGTDVTIPVGATIYYEGTDDRAGPLTKYTVVEPHVDA